MTHSANTSSMSIYNTISFPYNGINTPIKFNMLCSHHTEYIRKHFDKELENNKKLNDEEIRSIAKMLESVDVDSLILALDLLISSNYESIRKISKTQKTDPSLDKLTNIKSNILRKDKVKIFIDVYEVANQLLINKKHSVNNYAEVMLNSGISCSGSFNVNYKNPLTTSTALGSK